MHRMHSFISYTKLWVQNNYCYQRQVSSMSGRKSSSMVSSFALPWISQPHKRKFEGGRIQPFRSYFTNGDRIKKEDPFAALGLTWGATNSEIKEAFRSKARALHPDVNNVDSPEESLKKFQEIQKAYHLLMKKDKGDFSTYDDDDDDEQWRFQVWRKGDIIAQDRTDVAGVMRNRPIQPASSLGGKKWGIAALGHPDGRGQTHSKRRAEYLDSGVTSSSGTIGKTVSNSVGTGQNKWVTKKKFQPWDPNTVKVKGITKNKCIGKQRKKKIV
jgi:hypothetical protein